MATIVQDPITGSQDNRRVNAFLRGPIVAGQAGPRFALAAEAEVRNGVLHQAILGTLPSPRDAVTNNFGVQSAGGFDATIYAADLLPGTVSADGHWDGYSLVSLYGESPTSFTRNLPIPVPDWENVYRWTLVDEFAPAYGCRRVRNLLSDTEVLATQSVTVAAGTHLLVLGKCSGSVTLSGVGSGTLAGSTSNRKQLQFTATAGTLTLTVTGSVLQAMVVAMQGATNLVAPEYVPNVSTSVWPHAGFGVRGVVWFTTTNGNSVDGSGNITDAAGTPLSTVRPYYHTPPETNLLDVDIGSWNIVNTPVPTAATGPDGLASAWTLTDNDPAAFEYSFRAVTVANDSVTRSSLFLVKQDAVSSRFAGASLFYTGGTTKGHRIHINTVTGAITVDGTFQAGSHSVDTTTLPGWFIIRMSLTNNGTGNTTMTVECYPAYSTVAGTANVAAQGSTTFAWPMAVVGARADVYNPPSAGSRATSLLAMPTAMINDAEGFAYAEYEAADWATAFSRNSFGRIIGMGAPAPLALTAGQLAVAFDGLGVANTPFVAPSGKVRALAAWSGDRMIAYGNGSAGVEASYDGSWGGAAVYIGAQNIGAGEPFPAGSIGPIKWGKKRPPTSYLTSCNASRDLFSRGDFDFIRDNSKGTTWELELLSQIERRSNGAVIGTLEVTDVRRAVAKRISVTKNQLSISFADIDTDALDRVYPANKYSKEEFTNIYEAHIGKVVPDCSPGTQLKVPMAFINTNGTTTWTFAICERRTGPTYTVNTVYRDGRIVTASEYTVSTATATSGLVVVTVVFAREQRDTSGRQYEFTADITVSGNREPSREIDRLLQRVGITTDATSVTAAITEDAARGFYIDAAYTSEVQLKVIIEYLLQVARCDLTKTGTGAWALMQDKVRSSIATLRERDGLIDIESVEEPMPPRAYELKYRPRAPGSNDWQFTATRSGTGSAETLRIQNPYIYDGNVADRLVDYISKRENGRRDAKLKVYGAMFDNGDVLTVDGVSCYSGTRDWLIRGVERPTDANALTARQYDAAIYTYGAGTIPAGASSGYAPDYSQSTPAAPTALTYTGGSSGVTTSTDGTARAYMFYACTPPSVNYSRIVFQAVDAIGGITRVEGKRNGTVFEAVLTGLRPGVSHTVSAYAVNSNGIEGATVTETRNSTGYATTPGVVINLLSQQIGTKTIQWRFDVRPGSEMVAYYEAQISDNFGASWGSAFRVSPGLFEYVFATVGTTYGVRVRAVDKFGNAGSYSSGNFVGTAKWADGAVIVDAAINRSRLSSSAGFASYLIANGASVNIGLSVYAFSASYVAFPNPSGAQSPVYLLCSTDMSKAGGAEVSRRRLWNNAGNDVIVQVDYRSGNA